MESKIVVGACQGNAISLAQRRPKSVDGVAILPESDSKTCGYVGSKVFIRSHSHTEYEVKTRCAAREGDTTLMFPFLARRTGGCGEAVMRLRLGCRDVLCIPTPKAVEFRINHPTLLYERSDSTRSEHTL